MPRRGVPRIVCVSGPARLLLLHPSFISPNTVGLRLSLIGSSTTQYCTSPAHWMQSTITGPFSKQRCTGFTFDLVLRVERRLYL